MTQERLLTEKDTTHNGKAKQKWAGTQLLRA